MYFLSWRISSKSETPNQCCGRCWRQDCHHNCECQINQLHANLVITWEGVVVVTWLHVVIIEWLCAHLCYWSSAILLCCVCDVALPFKCENDFLSKWKCLVCDWKGVLHHAPIHVVLFGQLVFFLVFFSCRMIWLMMQNHLWLLPSF